MTSVLSSYQRFIMILGMIAVLLGCGGCVLGTGGDDKPLEELIAEYDVLVMKHCYPASEMVADHGDPDPSSSLRSMENFKAFYEVLRTEFDKHPDTTFIVWTLPPLHRLATNVEEAARATAFSDWLRTEWLTEDGQAHPNIRVWDFRSIVADLETGYLKYEYERSHSKSDSHPNDTANNVAGPVFAQFLVDTVPDGSSIMFLHRSTGGNLYNYPDLGVEDWIEEYNEAQGTTFSISEQKYPSEGNMPVHYYRAWLEE